MAVRAAESQRLQDEQVKRALQKVELFFCLSSRHSTQE
jgi:hypothetical protein